MKIKVLLLLVVTAITFGIFYNGNHNANAQSTTSITKNVSLVPRGNFTPNAYGTVTIERYFDYGSGFVDYRWKGSLSKLAPLKTYKVLICGSANCGTNSNPVVKTDASGYVVFSFISTTWNEYKDPVKYLRVYEETVSGPVPTPGGTFCGNASVSATPCLEGYVTFPGPIIATTTVIPTTTVPTTTPTPSIGLVGIMLKSENGYFYGDSINVFLEGKEVNISEVTLSSTSVQLGSLSLSGKWKNSAGDYLISLFYQIDNTSWVLDKVTITRTTVSDGSTTLYAINPINTVTSSLLKGLHNEEVQTKYVEWVEIPGSPKARIVIANVRTQPFVSNTIPTTSPTDSPVNTPQPYMCDIDGNGTLNSSDLEIWMSQFRNNQQPSTPSADCNNDGKVTILDYNYWLSEMKGQLKQY